MKNGGIYFVYIYTYRQFIYTYIHNIIYRNCINTAKNIWCDKRCKEIQTEQSNKYIITVKDIVKQKEHAEEPLHYNGPHHNGNSCPTLPCKYKKRYWINAVTKKRISPVLKENPDEYVNDENVIQDDLSEYEAHKVTETPLDWAPIRGIICILFLYYFYIIYTSTLYIQIHQYAMSSIHNHQNNNKLN